MGSDETGFDEGHSDQHELDVATLGSMAAASAGGSSGVDTPSGREKTTADVGRRGLSTENHPTSIVFMPRKRPRDQSPQTSDDSPFGSFARDNTGREESRFKIRKTRPDLSGATVTLRKHPSRSRYRVPSPPRSEPPPQDVATKDGHRHRGPALDIASQASKLQLKPPPGGLGKFRLSVPSSISQDRIRSMSMDFTNYVSEPDSSPDSFPRQSPIPSSEHYKPPVSLISYMLKQQLAHQELAFGYQQQQPQAAVVDPQTKDDMHPPNTLLKHQAAPKNNRRPVPSNQPQPPNLSPATFQENLQYSPFNELIDPTLYSKMGMDRIWRRSNSPIDRPDLGFLGPGNENFNGIGRTAQEEQRLMATANFHGAVHSTISKNHMDGEEARRSGQLAALGQRLSRSGRNDTLLHRDGGRRDVSLNGTSGRWPPGSQLPSFSRVFDMSMSAPASDPSDTLKGETLGV